MKYISINKSQKAQYIKLVNDQQATRPIDVLIPEDSCALPTSVLEIEGILDVMPELASLPILDENEITWMVYEDDI